MSPHRHHCAGALRQEKERKRDSAQKGKERATSSCLTQAELEMLFMDHVSERLHPVWEILSRHQLTGYVVPISCHPFLSERAPDPRRVSASSKPRAKAKGSKQQKFERWALLRWGGWVEVGECGLTAVVQVNVDVSGVPQAGGDQLRRRSVSEWRVQKDVQ